MSARGKYSLLGFTVTAAALVALNIAFSFGQLRLLAFGIQIIFVIATIGLLIRVKQRQQKTKEKLLEKITHLAEEMKREREDYRARSDGVRGRTTNPNGRN